ncbi:MAG: GNAT family N-acetyltransferase [Myxococcales bacterium]|nr:arginyl-tRNA--protein transferase [Polyangiaceae bacterium]MDW8249203.1 GNAT family N-acetyltransferase [Myxococcales bacterium]
MKRVLSPPHLSPRDLDDYLRRGWFRVGQTLITCRALIAQQTLLSTVWTRTDLHQFRFKRSLRRVMHRVEARFDVALGPACIDDEHEALYQRYLGTVRGSRARSLNQFLLDGEPDRGLFQTWEVSVREEGKLVAFSLFDLGDESLQSLLGVYEPRLARYGLGFYTMLKEVQFGVESGRRYFYAGYVLPGEPMMDYKLRTGHIWFLDDRANRWRPWSEYSPLLYVPPVERLRAALDEVLRRLTLLRIPARPLLYPMFELPAHTPSLSMCLDQPYVLECLPERHPVAALLVTWDIDSESYALVHALRAVACAKDQPHEEVGLLVVVEQHSFGHDLDALLQHLQEVAEAPWEG